MKATRFLEKNTDLERFFKFVYKISISIGSISHFVDHSRILGFNIFNDQ